MRGRLGSPAGTAASRPGPGGRELPRQTDRMGRGGCPSGPRLPRAAAAGHRRHPTPELAIRPCVGPFPLGDRNTLRSLSHSPVLGAHEFATLTRPLRFRSRLEGLTQEGAVVPLGLVGGFQRSRPGDGGIQRPSRPGVGQRSQGSGSVTSHNHGPSAQGLERRGSRRSSSSSRRQSVRSHRAFMTSVSGTARP